MENKYYVVPAEIMESNFPDEFANGTMPGIGVVETDRTLEEVTDAANQKG